MSSRAAGPADLRGAMAFLERALRDQAEVIVSALPISLAADVAGSWLRYVPSVLRLGGRLRVYLNDDEGELRSVAIVCEGHRPEWVVLALAADPERGGVDSAFDLLSHLSADAARHNVQRVFAACPDAPVARAALQQAGFYSYATESWFTLPRAELPAPSARGAARAGTSNDAHNLFRFYAFTTPDAVQRAEQLTIADFDIGRRVGAFDPPHLAGGDPLAVHCRSVLIEDGEDDLPRAMALSYEGKERHPHVLKLRSAVATDVELVRDLARIALSGLSSDRPVVSPVRSYEEHIARALIDEGFVDAGAAMLFVKELAIRIEEPVLAPAVVR